MTLTQALVGAENIQQIRDLVQYAFVVLHELVLLHGGEAVQADLQMAWACSSVSRYSHPSKTELFASLRAGRHRADFFQQSNSAAAVPAPSTSAARASAADANS